MVRSSTDEPGSPVAELYGNGDSTPDGPAPPSFESQGPPPPSKEFGSATKDFGASTSSQRPKGVDDVLYSDIGVSTLLNRLKQSIASARDFATFLKKRSGIEEEHAQGLKKLCRLTAEGADRAEVRQGSYAKQFKAATMMHDKIADNGMQFALSLHQMHEDLNELANNMERGRKQWKAQGLEAEKRVQVAEADMEKAKSKYNRLAEDYDRVRTGDGTAGRRFGIKGPKSASQHEEDLSRKVQTADSDYQARVQEAQRSRKELLDTLRPQAIREISTLIHECDSALTLQLQKFASFNEKLLLGNGILVSPINKPDGSRPDNTSMRDIVSLVDNDEDLNRFIFGHSSKVPPKPAEIEYKKHPALAGSTSSPAAHRASQQPTLTPQQQQGPPPSFNVAPQSQSSPQQYKPPPQDYNPPSQTGFQGGFQHQSVQSGGQPYIPPSQPQQQPPPQFPQQHYGGPPPHDQSYPTGPHGFQSRSPQSHQPPSSFMGGAIAPQHQQSTGVIPPSGPPDVQERRGPSGTKPVFGVSLDDLFRRDGSPVPMIVYQCIQAVDLFGLSVEGIYRVNGTAQHLTTLKNIFNTDANSVDFRNPEAFFHDVNSVAGLLKQWFRELPDPLLTAERYDEFIEAAKIEDDTIRRDSMHAVVNALPDPNYATLRSLVLHLNRVQEHQAQNRMSTANLAICFAPTILGPHKGPLTDAGLQARVVDTILQNTYQIFDED